jgi:hypothetical protein
MLRGWQKSIKVWEGVRQYLKDCASDQSLTFFSEGRPYHSFLHPVISAMQHILSKPVFYITCDEDDPYLTEPPNNVKPYFIGNGPAMIYLFTNTKTGTMVMTMPDLNKFHVKRSVHPVHYVYIFHSIVSTHMVYREGAFDHFDSILCVGPHQKLEIRAWEKLRGLPEKNLLNHGYGPLDALLNANTLLPQQTTEGTANRTNILIAPSWGSQGILETVGQELISILMAANLNVTVRPHPRTRELSPRTLLELTQKFGSDQRFALDLDTTDFDSLITADLMISDWSGAAMELSFGLGKPVLFIDVPPKVNNLSWEDISLAPLEVAYRSQVGRILSPSDIHQAPERIIELLSNCKDFADNIRALRKTHVYNVGTSGRDGARIIYGISQNPLKTQVH